MTQTQTRYKLVNPMDKTGEPESVHFVVEGENVWIHHFYRRADGVMDESTLTGIHPETGTDFKIRPGTPVSRVLAKAVWDRFVKDGFVRV